MWPASCCTLPRHRAAAAVHHYGPNVATSRGRAALNNSLSFLMCICVQVKYEEPTHGHYIEIDGQEVFAAAKRKWLSLFRGLKVFHSEQYGEGIKSVIKVGAPMVCG